MNYYKPEIERERKEHIRAATDLFYSVECIRKLKEAKTVIEMDNSLSRRKEEETCQ